MSTKSSNLMRPGTTVELFLGALTRVMITWVIVATGVTTLLVTVLCLRNINAKVDAILSGMHDTLVHQILVGDHYDINRSLASLVDSGTILGAWVTQGAKPIAHAGDRLSVKLANEDQDRRLTFWEGRPLLISKIKIRSQWNEELGQLVCAYPLPLFQIGGLFLLLVLLYFGLYRLGIASLARRLKQIETPFKEFSQNLTGIRPELESLHIPATSPVFEISETYKHLHALWGEVSALRKRSIENAELRAAARVSQQVAHDIRSPLTTLSILVENSDKIPEKKLDLLRSAVQRIRNIVITLSDNKVEEALEEESVADLIERVVSEKQIQLRKHSSIQLRYPKPQFQRVVHVTLEPTEFMRIISNLISNAVEAMDQGGVIDVAIEEKVDGLEVEVRDTGHGIPADVLPKLFQRGATFGKKTGSGLGLYHAKEWIEKWGGKIAIASSATGTQVKIYLPLASFLKSETFQNQK